MALAFLLPNNYSLALLSATMLGMVTPIQVLSTLVQDCINMMNQLVSVRRVVEYMDLPSEHLVEENPKNGQLMVIGEWPNKGKIEFKKASLSTCRELTTH